MAVVVRFFKCVSNVWQKVTCWVFFWRHKPQATILEHSGSKKHVLKKVEKIPMEFETLKLAESPREVHLSKLDECAQLPEPCMLTTVMDGTVAGHESRSLLQLSRSAVQSVSSLMLSALQSGWQMCRLKSSSVSSASITSQMRTRSPLDTPEAEMLREVYLVLWAIRKQLRQLARRQERRRRHHIQTHASPQPDPVQGLQQDARSPL